MTPTIVKASAVDAEKIACIEQNTFSEARTHKDIANYIDMPQCVCNAAKHDGELIGYIIVYGDDVISIAVNSDFRKRGIGGMLLDSVKKCKSELYLEVREGNSSAVSFYLKNGFEPVGIRKKYYSDGENAIIMAWHKLKEQ